MATGGDGARTIAFSTSGVNLEPATCSKTSNVVTTTKYTPLTWLPKSLFYQFQRIANVYFLFVAIIVCFPWSPKSWKSKVFPFAGVLLWTALKDLYEDMIRRRGDEKENSQTCSRFDIASNSFVDTQWRHIVIGDLVFIPCDGSFPSDLIVLVAAGGHEAFISTVNLDGETNLKERRTPPLTDGLEEAVAGGEGMEKQVSGGPKAARSSQALKQGALQTAVSEAIVYAKTILKKGVSIEMSKPEPGLADVRGLLKMSSDQCPVGEMNFLPRGCVLRNTVWLLAVVTYVGDETKTRLNMTKSAQKVSNMQFYLNRSVQGLLAILFLVNCYFATAATASGDKDNWLKKFLIWCICLYHVVPISLYVVFELLKLFLGFQVNMDKQMQDPETKQGAVARTADLMEEMGQIDFVFSDKTGTLTANEMVFARTSIMGQDLGDFRASSPKREGVSETKRILSSPGDKLHDQVKLFFTCLATCHAVQVEVASEGSRTRAGDLVYSGMSPDEVALVQAAHDVGIVFRNRTKLGGSASSEVLLTGEREGEDPRSFTVLYELEFNSDRKRMSVLLKAGDEVWCVTKGADSIMTALIPKALDRYTQDHLQSFSQQGLRTLVVAMKKVSQADFSAWEAKMKAALSIVDNTRNEEVAKISAEMEVDLTFVGLTAVEDRLQDGVPIAIQRIKDAGVRLWVLTGDKTETAVDIARSCALFTTNTQLAYATEGLSVEDTKKKLQRAKDDFKTMEENKQKAKEEIKQAIQGGLVLDGRTVKFALEDEECRRLVYELGLASRSCVCCRLSPMQKRQLVELVRQMSPSTTTLAIGDGANDVPMIEGAHLGIGIRGKEGTQAVQVSDIAISQFRFLVPLLLCHGRRAYRRVAFFLCYYLYKNVVLVISDVLWAHQNKWSGRIAYPEYLSMGFNAVFTSWHILFVLGYDQDVSDETAIHTPSLYLVGPKRALFNVWIFSEWMVYSVWHGVVAWLLPNLWIGADEYDYTLKCPKEISEALGWKALCYAQYYKKEDADDFVAAVDLNGDSVLQPLELANAIAKGWIAPEGEGQKFWLASVTSFAIVVMIVNFRLLLLGQSPFSLMSVLPTAGAFALFIAWFFALGEIGLGKDTQPTVADLPTEMFKTGKCLASLVLGPLIALSVDALEKVVRLIFFPTALDDARWGKCPNCGERFPPGAKFCPRCDAKDPSASEAPTAPLLPLLPEPDKLGYTPDKARKDLEETTI